MRYTKPTTNKDLRRQYLHHGVCIPGRLRLPLSMVCGLTALALKFVYGPLPSSYYSHMLVR
jgi:hypothetical protein